MSEAILFELEEVLKARKEASPETSYVARLYAQGIDAILKKVGEEAAEVILAAKGGRPSQVIYETADLWFHTLVMLAHLNIPVGEVLDELARRFGISGLEEKARRG